MTDRQLTLKPDENNRLKRLFLFLKQLLTGQKPAAETKETEKTSRKTIVKMNDFKYITSSLKMTAGKSLASASANYF